MTEWEKFERMISLKSDRIDLNIKQDVEKMLAAYDKASKAADDSLSRFYKSVFSAKETWESSKGNFNEWFAFQKAMKEEKDKALVLGKELGIDVTQAPFYKDLLAALNRFDDLYEEFTTANLTYKSIKI